MAQEVPLQIVGEQPVNPFGEEVANPEAPQGNAGNGGNGVVVRMNWTSLMSSRMLQKFALLTAEGIKTDKGFKYIHYHGIAQDLSAFMGIPVDASQVTNHLRKWRLKWLKICRLKNMSGASWDEEKTMITMDEELYTAHLKDHPKDDEFLNVALPNYHFLKTIFAYGVTEESKAGKRKIGPTDHEEEQEGKRKQGLSDDD